MGLYDTILFPCPNCGHQMEAQSKSGPCALSRFSHDHVPASIAADANRHAPFTCPGCGAEYTLSAPAEQFVRLLIVPYQDTEHCPIDHEDY